MGSCLSSTKCDVFLSFRGEDTRNTFTSHLYSALEKSKIKTYIDDKRVNKGDEISPSLVKAIKRAKLSVIVFSENYATSSWCLDELVQILKCKEKKDQIVVPVFYRVNPSDVRKQNGSFEIPPNRFNGGKRREKAWREALRKAANLSGWDSETIRSESKLIEEIVKDVKHKLDVLRRYEAANAAAVAGVATATSAFAVTSC